MLLPQQEWKNCVENPVLIRKAHNLRRETYQTCMLSSPPVWTSKLYMFELFRTHVKCWAPPKDGCHSGMPSAAFCASLTLSNSCWTEMRIPVVPARPASSTGGGTFPPPSFPATVFCLHSAFGEVLNLEGLFPLPLCFLHALCAKLLHNSSWECRACKGFGNGSGWLSLWLWPHLASSSWPLALEQHNIPISRIWQYLSSELTSTSLFQRSGKSAQRLYPSGPLCSALARPRANSWSLSKHCSRNQQSNSAGLPSKPAAVTGMSCRNLPPAEKSTLMRSLVAPRYLNFTESGRLILTTITDGKYVLGCTNQICLPGVVASNLPRAVFHGHLTSMSSTASEANVVVKKALLHRGGLSYTSS